MDWKAFENIKWTVLHSSIRTKSRKHSLTLLSLRGVRSVITGAAHNKLIIKSVENFTDIKVIAACLQEIDEKTGSVLKSV